ncbi:hypothetical protein AA13595_2901 [Gluconacetobacter johannae DSM 13595]|nr:hypothetical protein AA13595_2901 [Gluconacetobacter johannae DSM 13595]
MRPESGRDGGAAAPHMGWDSRNGASVPNDRRAPRGAGAGARSRRMDRAAPAWNFSGGFEKTCESGRHVRNTLSRRLPPDREA